MPPEDLDLFLRSVGRFHQKAPLFCRRNLLRCRISCLFLHRGRLFPECLRLLVDLIFQRMEPFLLGNLRSDEVCQIPCMDHRQLVEGTGAAT